MLINLGSRNYTNTLEAYCLISLSKYLNPNNHQDLKHRFFILNIIYAKLFANPL